MSFSLPCYGCGTTLSVPKSLAGQTVQCSNCHTLLQVPMQAQAASHAESSQFYFSCPTCRQRLRSPWNRVGDATRCSQCGTTFSVPHPAGDGSRQARQSGSTASAGNAAAGSHSAATKPLTLESRRNILLAFVVGVHVLPTFGSPPSTAIVWLMAGASLLVGLGIFRMVLGASAERTNDALWAFVFTAFAGIIALLVFQAIAEHAVHMEANRIGGVKTTIAYWIVKIIGYGYGVVLSGNDPQAAPPSFIGMLVATTISVGLCEEFIKLLPVLWYLMNRPSATLQDVLFIGALSGLGFGVSEGIHYSFNMYMPIDAPMSLYVFRFFGCAFGHGVLTVFASMMAVRFLGGMTRIAAPNRLTPSELAFIGFLAALSSAVPHALYNTFAAFGLAVPAGIVDAALVCVVASLAHEAAARGTAKMS